jgi:branched-chain amino acid transport system ATP-binding protein
MLELVNVKAIYGKVGVLWDVSLEMKEGELVTLIGANGAGKTTMLKTISGLIRPSLGSVEFLGQRIDGISPYQIVEMGISHVPEGGKAFPDMTVHANLEMGAYPKKKWKQRHALLENVYQMFPILKARAGQLAKTLSGGERQMLAMGRSLMAKPKLCMFDEPSYGLAPQIVGQIFEFLRLLHKQKMTIFIVEQEVKNALELADRAYILENGRIVLEGSSETLLRDDHIKKAYLGL